MPPMCRRAPACGGPLPVWIIWARTARCSSRSGAGESGGELAGAAEQPGQGDRVHVVVVADDLAVPHPDDTQCGKSVRRVGHVRPAMVAVEPVRPLFRY